MASLVAIEAQILEFCVSVASMCIAFFSATCGRVYFLTPFDVALAESVTLLLLQMSIESIQICPIKFFYGALGLAVFVVVNKRIFFLALPSPTHLQIDLTFPILPEHFIQLSLRYSNEQVPHEQTHF